jgi:hypothetical protein
MCTANRSRRPVEHGQETVAGKFYLTSAVPLDFVARKFVIGLQYGAPSMITDRSSTLG